MEHLIDQPSSLLQRVFQCAQRAIAIAVVGCAALALWAGPASAADTSSSAPAVSDQVPESVDTASPDAVPASTPEVPQTPTAPDATVPTVATPPAPALVQDVPGAASNASTSIHTAAPASDATSPAQQTLERTAGQVRSANETAKQALTHVSDTADVGGNQSAAGSRSSEMLRGGMTPPRSIAGSAISISVKHVMPGGMDRFASPLSLQVISGPASAGGAPSVSDNAGGSGPNLPGLPGPLQMPVSGFSGGSTTSSNGFFLFGFAGLLVGLLAAFAPAQSRRLEGSSASWRPAPYLSLLELPG